MIKTSGRFIVGYHAISIFISGFALIIGYPWHPITSLGWSMYFLLIPPLYLLGEFVGSKLMSKRISEKIESVKKASHISGQRMIYVFFIMVSAMIIILIIQYLLNHSFNEFIANNFSNEW
jgi:hypothetical protein